MAASFTLAFAAGRTDLARRSPLLDVGPDSIDGPADWTFHPAPEGDDWYLAYSDYSIDHHVLYHGLRGTLEPMRAADVLVIGASVVPIALPKASIERFHRETGWRVYNLGLGHAEKSAFFLDLIERNGLRPRFVVANGFQSWSSSPSLFGREVADTGRWAAIKTVAEHTLSGRLRLAVLDRLPHWRPPAAKHHAGVVVLRSRSTGAWRILREKAVHWSVPDLSGTPRPLEPSAVDPDDLAAARALRDGLARLGIGLILTEVPHPEWARDRDHTAAIAAALDVPFVAAPSIGLHTRDEEHLEDESAERFAPAFFEALRPVLEASSPPDRR